MARSAREVGPLDQQVMLAIMRQQPCAYGVSIQALIEERTGRSYSVGAIYAALDRLEENGYVASKLGEATAQRGGRRKLYFSLTTDGLATLQHSLQALNRLKKGLRLKESYAFSSV
jgi:PadR family transcriptional regulator PadR